MFCWTCNLAYSGKPSIKKKSKKGDIVHIRFWTYHPPLISDIKNSDILLQFLDPPTPWNSDKNSSKLSGTHKCSFIRGHSQIMSLQKTTLQGEKSFMIFWQKFQFIVQQTIILHFPSPITVSTSTNWALDHFAFCIYHWPFCCLSMVSPGPLMPLKAHRGSRTLQLEYQIAG